MEMKAQTVYAGGILIIIIIDPILNGILHINYDYLVEHNVFIIWWVFHLVEIILVYVFANIFIIKDAWANLKEFNGFVASKFPGQEKPRLMIIQPNPKEKQIQEQAHGHPIAVTPFRLSQNSDSPRTHTCPEIIVVEVH